MQRIEENATSPRWVSYADAERLYGLSRWTLWRLLKDDRIRAARVGRAVRLDCRSIEHYLEQQVDEFR